MTMELLASIAGSLLSLAFSYIPALKQKFDLLDGTYKRLVMLCVLLISAAGVFGLSCLKIIDSVSCDHAGALGVVKVFIAAMIANQTTYAISPQVVKTSPAS